MKNYTLNAELVSNKKISSQQVIEIREKMELCEDFILFYSVFLDSSEINFNGCLEIYVEDFEIETDLQQEIKMMLKDLDLIVPGGLSNDSKLEWTSGAESINIVWYKDSGSWVEKDSGVIRDLSTDEEWSVSDDFTNDDYNGYHSGDSDDLW